MDIFILLFVGSLFLIIGFIGCILPIVPGPPISLLSLFLLQFSDQYALTANTVFFTTVLVILVTFGDYWLQIYGVKKFGGQKKATYGAVIGLILGVIFSFLFPLLLIVGPFFGAYIGAKIENKPKSKPLKIALGSLIGFLGGSFIKLSCCLFITALFFNQLFDLI